MSDVTEPSSDASWFDLGAGDTGRGPLAGANLDAAWAEFKSLRRRGAARPVALACVLVARGLDVPAHVVHCLRTELAVASFRDGLAAREVESR